jgi:NAD(P)-dependent dehydrogenase (short-subunit alcohol dehydrogenase family)
MTNVARQELAPHGIQVAALHVGYMDTDMTAGKDVPKVDPAGVAALALDGIEADFTEILADDVTRSVKPGLSRTPARPTAVVA